MRRMPFSTISSPVAASPATLASPTATPPAARGEPSRATTVSSTRRRARWAALLATATAGALCMTSGVASADTITTAHRVFELKSAYSGNVADVPDWSSASGTPIVQWPRNGGANQRFFVELTNPTYSYYRIRNQHSNLCLQATPAGTFPTASTFHDRIPPGPAPVQVACNRYNLAQDWVLTRNSYGYYTIKNLYTDTFLHVQSRTAGDQLSVIDEFAVTWRMWDLIETKLPYSVDTPGITVPWGALGYDETGYCDDGWHVELDPGTWNPTYHNIGDAGVKITGKIFRDSVSFGSLVDIGEHNPRKVQFSYYQNSGRDSSRNYALTGRTRFYCQPGSDW